MTVLTEHAGPLGPSGSTNRSAEENTPLPKVGFTGTMPRSETWYLSLLLRFYSELRQGKPISVPNR